MKKCLSPVLSCYAKLRDGNPLHPVNSNFGLLMLSDLFDHDCLFIRTTRCAIDIFESFYAAREEIYKAPWLALRTDEDIFEYIEHERMNTKKQRGKIDVVDVDYDDLFEGKGLAVVASAISRHLGKEKGQAARASIKNTWGKVPSRAGRMMSEFSGSVVPSEMKTRINERLSQ